jgi:predicted NBD/HSP70 family sugar kinase
MPLAYFLSACNKRQTDENRVMADQTLAKFVNERNILTLLRLNGGASRATISRALALTPATISRLTSDMLKRGLLHEVAATAIPAGEREPGRPGIGVAVNPAGAYFLGVEIGVSVMRFVLIDLCTKVVESREDPLSRPITPQQSVAAIARVYREFQADPRYRGKISGGGVTVPGLVTNDGFIVNLPILGWRETNLRSLLSVSPDLPFSIENNANAAAFAAVYTQPETQVACSVFLKLGTGCGGAAIINGRLLRGADGTGMELGHLNLGTPGTSCKCGQTGCLETFVNLAALSRSYLGREPEPGEDLAALPTTVATALATGDATARLAADSLTRHLAQGLASLVNIFNPSQLILGGAMRPVLECCLDDLRAAVARRIIPGTRMPDLQISPLGPFECAIGAACVAHHKVFDISNVEIGTTTFADPVAVG